MAERSHWWTDRWLNSSLFLSFFLPSFLACLLAFFLSFSLWLSTYLPTYLPTYLLSLSVCLSLYLSIYLPTYLSSYLSICLSIYLSTYLSIYQSINLSIYLSIYQSINLSSYLSICKLENETILRDVLRFWTWQHQKRSNSMRLPQCLNLTTSKTKQFCEASSTFELNNVKNEAILRDFFMFWTWQPSKRSNSARLLQVLNLRASKQSNSGRHPSEMESWVQSWRPRTNALYDFSTPPV